MDADANLMRRMRAGDDAAVDAFVRKYYSAILRYCCIHLCNAADAEDCTQETFERFFRNFEQYRHVGKAANYLYVIAGNLCRDRYRRRVALSLDEEMESTTTDFIDRIRLEAAFRALPDELREVAILYFIEEMKQREIASLLGIGLPLTKYRTRRARELLQRSLGEEEEK